MKAAILREIGSPFVIKTVPDPILGTGEIIVDMPASPVLSYTNEVKSIGVAYKLLKQAFAIAKQRTKYKEDYSNIICI